MWPLSAASASILRGNRHRIGEEIMQLARVIGTVVATTKYEGLEGIKFLVVQPLTKQQEEIGEPVVAADGTAQAGPGHIVFIVGSREAAQGMPEPFVPVDHAIVGIVDDVEVATEYLDKQGF